MKHTLKFELASRNDSRALRKAVRGISTAKIDYRILKKIQEKPNKPVLISLLL